MFTIEDYASQGRTLVVSGNWSTQIESALREFGIDSVALNYARGYRERDLEFLHSGLQIRKLSILSRTTEDLTPVYRLASTLERINAEVSTRAALDLTQLPQVQSVSADWPQIKDTFRHAENLQAASVFLYGEADLRPLGLHLGLESLRLRQSPQVESLVGIEDLPRLKSLSVIGGRRLGDLSHLSRTFPDRLVELQIESCRLINSFEALHACQGLEFLNISNLGSVDSLAPLGALNSLRRLYAYESTNVIDGDLTPLLELPHLKQLKMMNRKSYTPSVAEVMQRLGASE